MGTPTSYPGRNHTKRGIAHARRTYESEHRYGAHEDHAEVDCALCRFPDPSYEVGFGIPLR